MEIILILLSLIAGFAAAWFLLQNKNSKSLQELNNSIAEKESQIKLLQSEKDLIQQSNTEKISYLEKERSEIKRSLNEEQQKSELLSGR